MMIQIIPLLLILIISQPVRSQETESAPQKDIPSSKSTLSTTKLKSLKSKAKQFLKSRKPNEAVLLLEEHATNLDSEGLKILAEAYLVSKRKADAIKIFELLMARNIKDDNMRIQLAELYLETEPNNKKSIRLYREIMESSPKPILPAYMGLLAIFRQEKNYYEMRTLLEVMINHFGKRPPFLSELCKLYYEGNFPESAISTCQEATKIAKDLADNHVYLGLTYQQLNKKEQATKILTQAAKLYPGSELAQWAAGNVYMATNDYFSAFGYFENGVKVNPESGRSHLGLAQAACELKKFEIAYNSFKKACTKEKTAAPLFKKCAAELFKLKESLWYKRYMDAAYSCQEH